MSHSLHRYGTEEDLKYDFCIYARCAKGVNRDDPGDKLRAILKIFMSEDFVNFGSSHAGRSYLNGLDPAQYAKTLDHSYGVIVNYASSEAVENVLRKLKEADLGISIVVSGLISEVSEIAKRVGLKPHTATISLGIYGKKSLLPEDDVLKITTMCGHSLIGNNLVRFAQKEIEAGRDPEEVADLLSRPCICGIFNVRRCAALMRNQDG